MKKILLPYLLHLWMIFIFVGYQSSCFGQTKVQSPKFESIPGQMIIDYAGTEYSKHKIPPPQSYFNRFAKNGDTLANFVVNYIGFEAFPEAKAAFQKAVDIWASILSSPVTIYVEANWSTFTNENVLGGASPGTYFSSGVLPEINTFYPVALAEKLVGRDLNSPGTPDISASFNRDRDDWYFGLDGNPASNQFDFVTIVLHELGHGLGFVGLRSFNENTGQGSLTSAGLPAVFDLFLENNAGISLLNQSSFPDPSVSLGDAFLAPLFFDGQIVTNTQGTRSALFAPSTFNPGSSTYHLNEQTYNNTSSSLMTPFADFGEVEQDPGPVTLQMFADMGWVHTFIRPDTLLSTETAQASYPVKAIVFSDSTLDISSITLHYSKDTFNTEQTVVMQATGNENEYSASIPGGVDGELIGYYVTAQDSTRRTYFSPSNALDFNRFFFFFAGTDNVPPTIVHEPITIIGVNDEEIIISAEITDIFGVDEEATYVEYTLNGVTQNLIPLEESDEDVGIYEAIIEIDGLNLTEDDSLTYRIVTQDLSAAQNQAFSPSSGFYKIEINGFLAVQNSYENDFNNTDSASEDFFGDAFSITTPAGFSNGAIHSEHPYRNGSGTNDESNYIYTLKVPVIINSTNPNMSFDEIALVEPGESGSTFGQDDFYDYVIVEGSKNGGKTWTRLLNGYDARARSSWLSRYNGGLDNATGNSSATGIPSLFTARSINIDNTFNPGDTVVFRFRLFADQLANGWGWAIDNLNIQGNVTALEVFFGANQNIKLYPNPSKGDLSLEAELIKQPKNLEIEVLNLQGQAVFQKKVANNRLDFSESLSLGNLPAGLYLMRIKTEAGVITKRFVINR